MRTQRTQRREIEALGDERHAEADDDDERDEPLRGRHEQPGSEAGAEHETRTTIEAALRNGSVDRYHDHLDDVVAGEEQCRQPDALFGAEHQRQRRDEDE